MPQYKYDKTAIKRGLFLTGGEVPNWFEPPTTITKGQCRTAPLLQQRGPTLAEIGARIQAVTNRLAEVAKAIHEAKRQ